MKSFVTALVIAAVLVCGGIIFNMCLRDISSDFREKCEMITEEIQNGNYDEAVRLSEELEEYSDRKKTLLASIINHENIDDIEMCITELEEYANNQKGAEALVRCRKLEHMFEHLPDDYSIKPQNIL